MTQTTLTGVFPCPIQSFTGGMTLWVQPFLVNMTSYCPVSYYTFSQCFLCQCLIDVVEIIISKYLRNNSDQSLVYQLRLIKFIQLRHASCLRVFIQLRHVSCLLVLIQLRHVNCLLVFIQLRHVSCLLVFIQLRHASCLLVFIQLRHASCLLVFIQLRHVSCLLVFIQLRHVSCLLVFVLDITIRPNHCLPLN